MKSTEELKKIADKIWELEQKMPDVKIEEEMTQLILSLSFSEMLEVDDYIMSKVVDK